MCVWRHGSEQQGPLSASEKLDDEHGRLVAGLGPRRANRGHLGEKAQASERVIRGRKTRM